VTILISAINNDNFNHNDTVIYTNAVAAVTILTSLITNLAHLLVIEAVSFISYSVAYFRNVYIILNYYTAYKLFFKFMKQKCYFCSILTTYCLPVTYANYFHLLSICILTDKFQICAVEYF